jgi:CheY-like chemotaxis protein
MIEKPILVAEDEETDIQLLHLALQKALIPNELVIARDGKEAVDYLSRRAEYPGEAGLPALFILDLSMPRMSGFDVLEWLRARPEFQSLAVVVLTSSTFDSDIRKALQLGASGFYVKPSGLAALTDLMRRLQARWLGPQPAQQAPRQPAAS